MEIKYTNSKHTHGTQTFDNGDSYTGQFKDDKKHGKGILTSLNGRTYDGCWENDIPHGPGVAHFPMAKLILENINMEGLLDKVCGPIKPVKPIVAFGKKGSLLMKKIRCAEVLGT